MWLESEGSMGGYRSHQVAIDKGGSGGAAGAGSAATRGPHTHSVELVLCPNWPHQSVPVSNCVHLVDCVNKKIPSGTDIFH